MKKYNKYKNSGAEWLGEIPEHWEVTKVKNVFKLVAEPAPKNNNFELLSVYTDIGVKPRKELEERGNKASSTDGYWFVKKGDIVVNKLLAWMGAIGVSNYDGVTSPAYDILRAKLKLEPLFYHYLFRNDSCISELKKHSRGIMDMRLRLYFDKFGDILIPYPPHNEQQTIISYINKKTTKIDQAVTIKQKQIELLKERRQTLIHKAVTRGLDDDVKLKDSGVEWIGEIPEHWKVKKFRNTFKLGKGLTITKENLTDEGVYCVNYGEIHSKFGFEVNPVIHKLKCVHPDYLINNSSSLLNEGDFVFADTSEDIKGSGNFTYLNSKEQVFAGYHTVIARPTKDILSRFIAYEFDSLAFKSQIHTKVKGVKVYSITQSILKELTILLPPKNEQLEIVNYLDNTTSKIATIISLKEQEIEKLKEYKMSLIDAVVTGKVKIIK